MLVLRSMAMHKEWNLPLQQSLKQSPIYNHLSATQARMSELAANDSFVNGSSFFGFMGVSMALVLANLGAAYGTAKAGTGISSIAIWKPSVVMKSLIPVVMAGILGIYGMIVAVIISQKVKKDDSYNYKFGYGHMASGLVCGFSCVAAGYAIGIVGDVGIRANAQQEKLFVGLILILIFGEALALYGLIVSLILVS